MRLLEIKNKIDSLLDGDHIEISVDARYSGYAQAILKSRDLFSVLRFFSNQEWNQLDFSPVEQIIVKYGALAAEQITVDQAEYDQVNSYVKQLNEQLPIFLGIIDTIIQEQDPQDINIKLSSSINTPKKLNELTQQITELEKFSNIDGKELQFKGFDKGTDWIVLSAITKIGHAFLIACLKLAQEVLKTKEEYYKSATARLAYLASQEKSKRAEFSDTDFKKHLNNFTQVQLEEGAKLISDNIGTINGNSSNEIEQKALKTAGILINIIGNGNEVHLSLNPPQEISENADGHIEFDYTSLAKIAESETKQLQVGKEKKKPTEASV